MEEAKSKYRSGVCIYLPGIIITFSSQLILLSPSHGRPAFSSSSLVPASYGILSVKKNACG